ncbi:hypothetical protein ACLB1Q_08880 [Escherichia coli]
MFLINGHERSLAVSDRATQFGDGFYHRQSYDGKVSFIGAYPATTDVVSG